MLEAIYAAFGIGWDETAGADQRGRDLTEEAIWLVSRKTKGVPKTTADQSERSISDVSERN